MNPSEPNVSRESFTHREIEVLRMIAGGLTNQEISRQLHVSTETVKWYAKQLYPKLGVSNRTQAALVADTFGLLDFTQKTAPNAGTKRVRGNLPAQLTTYVGRTADIANIKNLIAKNRLVTLTGAGGIGKTRLALQVADELQNSVRDGVWLVELAEISAPTQVLNAIARVLAFKESMETPLDTALNSYLRNKTMLFVIDNFEHLLDAAPLVGDLLAHAPGLSVLTTSRERLHLYGEVEYSVSPLELPTDQQTQTAEELRRYDAIALFVERAHAVRPGYRFDDVQIRASAQICALLDGLPLAIELAAPLVKIFPPSIIAERLRNSLDTLPPGPRNLPSRQRTLRATLDWSYALLDDDEKALLANISVFRGGGTLEAIESICVERKNAALFKPLTSLVNRNLVIPAEGDDGEIHFTLLSTARQLLHDRLIASGHAVAIFQRHAEYYAGLAERAMGEYSSPNHTTWFARVQAEQDNLRSAFVWSIENDRTTIALRLVGALREYWRNYLFQREGLHWALSALAHAGESQPALRANALLAAGSHAIDLEQIEDGNAYLDAAIELFTQLGDRNNAARSIALRGFSGAETPDDIRRGIDLALESLEVVRSSNDLGGMTEIYNLLGELARMGQDFDMAEHYYRECLGLAEESGERLRVAMQYTNLGTLAYQKKEYDLAATLTKRGLRIFLEMGVLVAVCYDIAGLAGAALGLGNPARAGRLLGVANAGLGNLEISHQQADHRVITRILVQTRAALDEQSFQKAWDEGQRMTLQEAFEYALAGPDRTA